MECLPESVERELRLQPLDALSHSADVVIVGAGVAGLSAALAARAGGAVVAVVEAAPTIGLGATGRNAGILSAGINMGLTDLPAGSPLAEMWPLTTHVLLNLVDEASRPGALLSASLTGALSLAETASAARHLAREAQARRALDLRAEMWTPERAAEATGDRLNTSTVRAALWLPDEGRIHPVTLLAHLACQARDAGVILVGGAKVAGRDGASSKGSVPQWRLSLEGGATISARSIIYAVGPTAEPTARIFALAFAADLPDSFPLFWDSAPYTYADYRAGNGRLGVSGGRYGRPGGGPSDVRYHARLADGARRWLPELVGKEPTHAWAVDLAVAKDIIPALRELDGRAPALAIEGLGALGVLPGMVLGRRAGEQIAHRLTS